MGLTSSPIKIWGKSVQGFLSYDRTNKQTPRQTEITTLYLYIDRKRKCLQIEQQLKVKIEAPGKPSSKNNSKQNIKC